MTRLLLATTGIILLVSFSITTAQHNGTFPYRFSFGVASSAYQTEGAWDEDGKGENIWDRWIHDNSSRIKNNDTGDVATDFYHHHEGDVALASVYLAVRHYILTISWSRIFPDGTDEINLNGVMFYKAVIDEIRDFGMTPVVVLYHYDLPQSLQDIGGWTNPEIIDRFVNYARVAFQNFDKVRYWITFNDPRSTCRLGYGEGAHPPGIANDGIDDYLCTYVVVKTHAAVYHMYKEEFPDSRAPLSLAIDLLWSEPFDATSVADTEAAERRNQFEIGLYANPIFNGNWPQVVIDRVGDRSKNENLTTSRLPVFTQEEIDYINGTFDFMAINVFYYNIKLVKHINEPAYGDPGYVKDMQAEMFPSPDVPFGVRNSLRWLKETYNDPEIYITGNGIPDEYDTLEDDNRINFYRHYLDAVLDSIYYDDVRVFAYAARSLTDSFEWTEGYSQKYGFYHVNFTDPDRKRTKRKSVNFYLQICNSYRVPKEETTTNSITSSTTGITTTTAPPTTTTAPPTTTTGSANKIILYPLTFLTCGILFYILH